MTKKDIVKDISEKFGRTQVETKAVVQGMFDAIVEGLIADGRIELRNFGVFEVKERAARKARNPRTGEQVAVSPRRVVVFRPGRLMEASIDGGALSSNGAESDDEFDEDQDEEAGDADAASASIPASRPEAKAAAPRPDRPLPSDPPPP
ncbi:MAG: integration host factor subunit beta [Planctomycetes bacterium]|nr:integration host factor subunit beta [Planctomycetota bacterium]